MKFGSDEVIQYIEEYLQNPENMELQKKLYDVIRNASLPQLYGMSLPAKDYDDVVQEIAIKVFKHLGQFYLDYMETGRSAGERNKWLRTIVKTTCLSYIRKRKAEQQYTVVSMDSVGELDEEPVEYESNTIEAEKLADVLERISKINTTIDKTMAFLLLEMRKEKNNAKPKELSAELDGMRLQDVFDLVCTELQDWGVGSAAANAIAIMQEKLKGHEDECFSATPVALSDKSNWIRTKIKKQQI